MINSERGSPAVSVRALLCWLALFLVLTAIPGFAGNTEGILSFPPAAAPVHPVSSDPPARPATADSDGPTVLIYHRFGDERYPTTNISLASFREQLSYLKTNRYQVLPLAILIRSLAEKKSLPARAVVITIDDGYRSVYENAWPLLREYGYPFTVFVYVRATDNHHHDYMSWDQIRELQDAGVDFQSHSYGHYRFGGRPPEMSEKTFQKWIRDDFTKSASIMERELGRRPRAIAAPYGEYNRTVIATARQAGYEALFTQDPGSVSSHTGLYTIPREPILGIDWSTMEHFKMVLNRVDLPLADPVPDLGRLTNATPPVFSARLLFPERYIPGSLGIYVSELGWQPATLEGDMARITNTRTLQRRLDRVAVSAREKESGRTAIHFWLLVNEMSKEKMPD